MTKKPRTTYSVDTPNLTAGAFVQSIEELNSYLQSLPPKEKPLAAATTREIVAKCKPAIENALANGYSWNELLAMLIEKTGKKIELATLRSYMQNNRNPSGEAPATARRHSADHTAAKTSKTPRESTRARLDEQHS